MAAAAAVDTPGGYFVGPPVHYQELQPHRVPVPAVDEQNAVKAQVPGYYAGPVQGRQDPAAEHKNPANTAVQQSQEQGFLARWFGCFTGRSGNAKTKPKEHPSSELS